MIAHHRKGLALLLVLASLTMVTGSLALLSLGAAQSHRAVVLADHERLIRDMLCACEPITQDWLKNNSRRAVVDPDLAEPRVSIASISWIDHEGRDCAVQITAWDLLGMLPPGTNSSSPLWLALPVNVRDARRPNAYSLRDLEQAEDQIYPTFDGESTSIGSNLAFHPLLRERSRHATTPTININTAPKKLLEEAMPLAQRGGIESVIEARRDGRPAPVPPRIQEPTRNGSLMELTGQSTLWAVRTDPTLDGTTRSWWTVYSAGTGGFEILERHAISE